MRNLATRIYTLKFHSMEGSLKYLIGLFALKLKGGVDMVSFLIAKSPGFMLIFLVLLLLFLEPDSSS